MPEAFFKTESHYTTDRLKDLLKKAWDIDVAKKEEEMGRPLLPAEKTEIKITEEFINRYHKAGLLPSLRTFHQRFSSIIHLANLLELPSSSKAIPETWYEGNRGEYIILLKDYVRKFVKENNRKPTRTEVSNALKDGKIPGVTLSILYRIKGFTILGIPKDASRDK